MKGLESLRSRTKFVITSASDSLMLATTIVAS